MDIDRYVPQPLDFSTVFNLRDLGGHAGADGRRLRRGVLYRADGLFRLAGDDLDRFAALNIRSVLDLRRPDELATDGRIPELPGLVYRNINLQATLWSTLEVAPADMPEYLAARYAEMADEALESGTMAAALRFLISSPGPTVFHCLAGKDRTGVIAALVLAMLDVPDEAIANDYAVSQRADERHLAWLAEARPDLPAISPYRNAAPAEAMLRFLTGLRDRYGSVPGYVERLGLDGGFRDELRARLLEG